MTLKIDTTPAEYEFRDEHHNYVGKIYYCRRGWCFEPSDSQPDLTKKDMAQILTKMRSLK